MQMSTLKGKTLQLKYGDTAWRHASIELFVDMSVGIGGTMPYVKNLTCTTSIMAFNLFYG